LSYYIICYVVLELNSDGREIKTENCLIKIINAEVKNNNKDLLSRGICSKQIKR